MAIVTSDAVEMVLDDDHTGRVIMEKYSASILAALALAAILWVGSSVKTSEVQLASFAARLQAVERAVTSLENKLEKAGDDRYRGEDAKRDQAMINKRIEALNHRHEETMKQFLEVTRQLIQR